MEENSSVLFDRIAALEKVQLNSEIWPDIVIAVDNCMVPGLIKPYDEYSDPLEKTLGSFLKTIGRHLIKLDKILKMIEPKLFERSLNYDFIASMLLLLDEMRADDYWANDGYTKYSKTVFDWLQRNTHTNLTYYKTDSESSEHFDDIFQICLKKLYLKLTTDKWKFYPAEIYCYRSIVNNWIENHTFNCPLPLIFPGTLIQIDDCHIENKIEGLKCCSSIMKNLLYEKYGGTGYEVAVYKTVVKYLKYREVCILDETLECLISILPGFHKETLAGQWSKCDEILGDILVDLYMEADLKRKTIYFKYLPLMIRASGICAIRWKHKLFDVIIDNLEICLNDKIQNKIIFQCLKCLKNWLQVGWSVWEYRQDSKLILTLFKIILVICEEPFMKSDIYMAAVEDVLYPLLSLCTAEEKLEFFNDDNQDIGSFNEAFCKKWNIIKKKAMKET